MAQCETCGYEMQPFDTSCPKCALRAAEPRSKEQEEGAAEQPASPAPGAGAPTRYQLAAGGAVAGAIYGAAAITSFLLIDRFVFGGRESVGMGLIGVVLLGVITGGLLGAVVGAVTMVTGSTGAGIVTSALILALLKGVGMSLMGYGGGITAVSFVVGGIYGAVLGLAVAGGVAKSVSLG
jgi:hypothetical protein